jgi:cellulose synthase/poly-beta-1,6-N-acetylglucosamine synthase-like glycosyltransferase
LLFFLDSDCLLHSDTLQRAEAALEEDPKLAGIIGAYDLAPESESFLSKFRNLMHSYYHHGSTRSVNSFWGACGAVRREAFFAVGGFSVAFSRPSIEDAEFGLRLHESGARIMLDPRIQVKHRKRWTFWTMLRTDIRDRAIPWTQLILRRGKMDNQLNTSYGQRLSVFLVLLSPWLALVAWPLSVLSLLIVVMVNWPLYGFLAKHWNLLAAAASIPLHLLYFAYSGLAFGAVTLAFRLRLVQ